MQVTDQITRRQMRKRCIKQIMTGRMPQVMCGACNAFNAPPQDIINIIGVWNWKEKSDSVDRQIEYYRVLDSLWNQFKTNTYFAIAKIRANAMLKGLQRDNGRMSVKPVKAKACFETKENRCQWNAEWCCKEIMEDVTRAWTTTKQNNILSETRIRQMLDKKQEYSVSNEKHVSVSCPEYTSLICQCANDGEI